MPNHPILRISRYAHMHQKPEKYCPKSSKLTHRMKKRKYGKMSFSNNLDAVLYNMYDFLFFNLLLFCLILCVIDQTTMKNNKYIKYIPIYPIAIVMYLVIIQLM